MYEQEFSVLLSLLSRAVGGAADPCVVKYSDGQNGTVDAAALCRLAREHSVTNLLYFAVREEEGFPRPLRDYLERELYRTAHRRVMQEREAARLFAALREAGIRFLPMKGEHIRALYPDPDMRTSSDIDLYYDKARREEAERLMRTLGYEKEGTDANHDGYVRGNVMVEMHRNLLIDFARVDAYYADVFARFPTEDGVEYRMGDEDAYIYMTVHTMKHFITAGTGIRSILDTYIYLREKPDLDRAYLEGELRKLGLLTFHLTLERLSRVWFGGEEMTPELAPVAEYVLGSGTYGQGENRAVNNAAASRGGRVGYLFSRAFPPYRHMAEKYLAVRRFPPLLPFFWIGRLVRAAFSRDRVMEKEMRAVSAVDRERAARLSAVMERAGLGGYREGGTE